MTDEFMRMPSPDLVRSYEIISRHADHVCPESQQLAAQLQRRIVQILKMRNYPCHLTQSEFSRN